MAVSSILSSILVEENIPKNIIRRHIHIGLLITKFYDGKWGQVMSFVSQSGKDMVEMFEIERQYQMKKRMAEAILNSDVNKKELTQEDCMLLLTVCIFCYGT